MVVQHVQLLAQTVVQSYPVCDELLMDTLDAASMMLVCVCFMFSFHIVIVIVKVATMFMVLTS